MRRKKIREVEKNWEKIESQMPRERQKNERKISPASHFSLQIGGPRHPLSSLQAEMLPWESLVISPLGFSPMGFSAFSG